MEKIIPQLLQPGDEVRVIAPARSMALISQETQDIANQRFAELGLSLTFGKHIQEKDMFFSSSIESRVADLHAAFSDPNVKAIFTVIGGFNSNQIIDHLNWDLIRQNPKIICGFSDITTLNNAILAKTGLVTFSGPHYSTFGQKLHFEYTLEHATKMLMLDGQDSIRPAKEWTDDAWFMDQDNRHPIKHDGYWIIQEGQAEGAIVGGNLGTLNLLQGTEYYPDIADSILFIEDCVPTTAVDFDRLLQSLLQQKGGHQVRGVVIGRFQKDSKVTREQLEYIIATKSELKGLPVIANVDFGHTNPMITIPIGGQAKIDVNSGAPEIRLSL